MLEPPQRHRDTEKTQSHPPTSQTRRHEDTKNSQSRPPTHQRRGAETQRRRASCRRLHRTARSRPSDDGQKPLGQETVPKTSFRSGFLTQRPALRKRRPRRFSFPFNSWEKYTSPIREEVRQNQRAKGAAAGEKSGGDEHLRSEQTGFSPATGDCPIACCSAINKRDCLSGLASASLRSLRSLRFCGMGGWIWVYLCDLWANLGGSGFAAGRLRRDKREALRLCGSAPLRSFWCSPLVSWCLGGSKILVSLA